VLGDTALPALQEALHDDDSEIRARAAMLIDVIRLGVTPELRSKVGNLLAGFDARTPAEKKEILERLQELGGASAYPALERILRVETDETILEDALQRMASIKQAPVVTQSLARLAGGPAARPWHVQALARRLAGQGDLAGAIARYEAAIARGIESPALRLAYAETLFSAGLTARALPVFERIASSTVPPDEAEDSCRSLYFLGECLFAAGRFDDALSRYSAAARGWLPSAEEWGGGRDDPFTTAAQRMGDCLRRLNRSAEAEARWAGLLDPDGATPAGRLRVAELLRRDGQVPRALAVARDVLRGADSDDFTLRNRAASVIAIAGRPDEALAAHRAMKQPDGQPAFPEILELLLRITGQPKEALRLRLAAEAGAEDNVSYYLEAAATAEKAELLDEAAALYRKAMARFPQFPVPARRLADLCARRGRYEEALAIEAVPLATALRCHEALGRIDAGIALAGKLKEGGNADDDSDLDIRRRGPGAPFRTATTLARLYRSKGLTDKGIEAILTARPAFYEDQRIFDLHMELGRLREEAQDLPGALSEYVLAWHHSGLRAMDVQEARRRAAYLVAQDPGAPARALQSLRRASKLEPFADPEPSLPVRGAVSQIVQGEILALAGNFAGAADAYEQADAILPRKPGTGCRAAEFLARAGDTAAARRRLERVAAEWPDDPAAYRLLERIARAAGNAAEADGFKARAASAGTLDKEVCFRAAQYFMASGDLDAASAEWEKLAAAPGERFTYDTNAHEYLGHLGLRAGRWEEAAGYFRRVLQERELRDSSTVEEGGIPYPALVHYGSGRAAEGRGERAAAAQEYAAALRLAPDFPDAHEALARAAAEATDREAHRAAADAVWRGRIADAPRDPEPRYRLASFLLDTAAPGDTAARDEARRLAREARERLPGEARYEDLARRVEAEGRR
jgi:tetratricopeptide (TPR) repeat protein